MKITFHIKELGRLRDTSFDLHPFLIFTGDSNLGKSYCAFLVHGFFRMLSDLSVIQEIERNWDKIDFSNLDDYLDKLFQNYAWKHLRYLTGNEQLQVKVSLKLPNIKYEFSPTKTEINYKGYIDGNEIARGFYYHGPEMQHKFPIDFLSDIFNSMLSGGVEMDEDGEYIWKGGEYESFRHLLFPPARGGLIGFNFSMKKVIANLGMYEIFLEDLDFIQKARFDNEIDNLDKINSFLNSIFGGELTLTDKGVYMYSFNNKSIPLVSAASSIKELTPLFFLLKSIRTDEIHLLFEEPESHLHPSMQVKVADLLAYMVGQGAYLQVTTHSDYMLSEWNNLLRLYFIRQKSEVHFQQAIAETGTQPDAVLNPEKVGAYYFKEREDGSVELVKSEINENQQIQFDSFKNVVNKLNENRFLLKEMLEELTEEKA